jgi:hypothetical protein
MASFSDTIKLTIDIARRAIAFDSAVTLSATCARSSGS